MFSTPFGKKSFGELVATAITPVLLYVAKVIPYVLLVFLDAMLNGAQSRLISFDSGLVPGEYAAAGTVRPVHPQLIFGALEFGAFVSAR